MSTIQVILILLLLGAILVFMYVILPRIGDASSKSGKLVRAILFLIVVGYLSYDFYIKGKYAFLAVLVIGSLAFFKALFSVRKDK
jgi:hypothetical protein